MMQLGDLVAYPVPMQEQTTIRAESQKAKMTVELTDVSGVVLRRAEATHCQQLDLPTTHLTPGLYYLRVTADGEVRRASLVKSE